MRGAIHYIHDVLVTLSTASASDIGALAALRTAVADDLTRQHGPGPWSVKTSKSLVRRQMRATRMLVARQGEEIVGTVRLIQANQALFDFSRFTPATVAVYVIGLAVSPHCRARGVGRQIMDGAKQAARDWPADALWLDTHDHAAGAGGFYEKCGFRRVGESFNQAALRYYEWRVGDV